MNRPNLKRYLIVVAKVGLGVGLLAWLILSDRIQLERLGALRLDWRVAALIALVASSMIIPAFRWWWLVRIQGLNEPAWRIVSLTWAGYFAGLVLPGTAGADVARSYLILRHRDHARARAFSTVLADRFLGLLSLFFIATLAAVWMLFHERAGRPIQMMAALSASALVLMSGGLTALLCTSSRRLLFRFLPVSWRSAWNDSFAHFRASLLGLLGCFGLSMISSIMTILSFVVAGWLLGGGSTWTDSFLAAPLVIVANCLPITPGGIGLAEAISNQLFSSLGSSYGAEIMILLRACGFVVALPGVFAAMTLLRTNRVASKRGGTLTAPQFRRSESAVGCEVSRATIATVHEV